VYATIMCILATKKIKKIRLKKLMHTYTKADQKNVIM